MELLIDHVSKRFKDKKAVNDISLELTPGVWGLLGANGAGKTTLMRMIAGIMQQILASHQVTLEIKEISYDQWHEGEIESDIWLNSANFTLPLDFSLFAHLCEVPLLQHCIPIDWQADAARWRNGE